MSGDYTYNDYEHWMREADRASIQSHQAQYAAQFDGCSNVLDIGCGEGLFLELLERAGISAVGVDREPRIVERAKASGRDVKVADAV